MTVFCSCTEYRNWYFASIILLNVTGVYSSDDARRLVGDLLLDYNRLVRPVVNNTQTLQVRLTLKLSQLLDVEWYDHKLRWNPKEYDGTDTIFIPAQMIWLPDIVLYNTADGNYELTIMTKATVRHDGLVVWEPPAVFRSMCEMDVKWFPFDEQRCKLKFGTWSYDGFMVDLIHFSVLDDVKEYVNDQQQYVWRVDRAVDLSGYYPSVEWDILEVPGERHFLFYPCCEAPFVDITYYIHLRRKTLFYTVNLIIPCVGISFLTMFVFYLPADSGEKIVMCISILISLNVFFLLLIELIPSTSLVMPLIGRYLLFTMILVTLSVAVTVLTLSIRFRAPTTHDMPDWVRRWFMEYLPSVLGLRPLKYKKKMAKTRRLDKTCPPSNQRKTMYGTAFIIANDSVAVSDSEPETEQSRLDEETIIDVDQSDEESCSDESSTKAEENLISEVWERRKSLFPLLALRKESKIGTQSGDKRSAVRYAASCIALIAKKVRREAQEKEVQQNWSMVAMVIDRLFLYFFSITCIVGTCCIIFQAPSLYDTRSPIP